MWNWQFYYWNELMLPIYCHILLQVFVKFKFLQMYHLQMKQYQLLIFYQSSISNFIYNLYKLDTK